MKNVEDIDRFLLVINVFLVIVGYDLNTSLAYPMICNQV